MEELRLDLALKLKSVRVMTFNIRHGRGVDNEINLPRIARVIQDAGAEVVALNEVDRRTRRSGGVDQVEELANLLDMEYAFSPSIEYQGGQYGNAVLSRWPIEAAHVYKLPELGPEVRTLLYARIAWDGEPLHCFVTHLGLCDDEQRAQLRQIAKVLEATPGPKILAGDFNFDASLVDWLNELPATMRELWTLQQRERLFTHHNGLSGNTFPSRDPKKRIDYILASEELELAEPVLPVHTLASDHLPVVGTLARRM